MVYICIYSAKNHSNSNSNTPRLYSQWQKKIVFYSATIHRVEMRDAIWCRFTPNNCPFPKNNEPQMRSALLRISFPKVFPWTEDLVGGRQAEKGIGGILFESFAISQRSRVPDSYQNCVPAPSPAITTTAKRSTITKIWISAYMYKYVVSFRSCSF